MAGPLVSVIIPFYNCPYVNQAIHSVLQQTDSRYEILVVDDGSQYHQQLLDPYRTRIHYLGKANGGTASALNHGLSMASGEYIAWLSSDDYFYPQKLGVQLDYMQRHQALISCTDFDHVDADNRLQKHAVAAKFSSAADFVRACQSFCPINGCTMMMHRSLLNRVGWFDESLRYTQDYDYWMRVVLSHIDFHFINETLTAYRWHEGMGTIRHLAAVNAEFAAVKERYAAGLAHLLVRL